MKCCLKLSAPVWSREELRCGRKNRGGTRPVWKTGIYIVRRESRELRLECSMPCASIQCHTVWALSCFSWPMGKSSFFPFRYGSEQVVMHIGRKDTHGCTNLPNFHSVKVAVFWITATGIFFTCPLTFKTAASVVSIIVQTERRMNTYWNKYKMKTLHHICKE